MKLKEAIFAIFASSFVGIMGNPEVLMASNSVAITGVKNLGVVETIPYPVVNDEPAGAFVLSEYDAVSENVAYAGGIGGTVDVSVAETKFNDFGAVAPAVQSLPENYVSFNGIVAAYRFATGDPGEIASRNGKLISGHNYTEFGQILSLGIGDSVTVAEEGVATVYRVAEIIPYDVRYTYCYDGSVCSSLWYDGSKYAMNAMTKKARGHALALMTCAGDYDPEFHMENQRYVVFLD